MGLTPKKKVVAGVVGGNAAATLIWAAHYFFGFTIPMDVAMFLVANLAGAIAYMKND